MALYTSGSVAASRGLVSVQLCWKEEVRPQADGSRVETIRITLIKTRNVTMQNAVVNAVVGGAASSLSFCGVRERGALILHRPSVS